MDCRENNSEIPVGTHVQKKDMPWFAFTDR